MGKKKDREKFFFHRSEAGQRLDKQDDLENKELLLSDKWRKKYRFCHKSRSSFYFERTGHLMGYRKKQKLACPICFCVMADRIEHCGFYTVTVPWLAKCPKKDAKKEWGKLFKIYPKFAEAMNSPIPYPNE